MDAQSNRAEERRPTLSPGPSQISRREFLKGTATATAGLVLNNLRLLSSVTPLHSFPPDLPGEAHPLGSDPTSATVPLLAFHLDAFDVQYEMAHMLDALAAIHDLGGTSLRTHLWWFDLEPELGQWDTERIAWYRHYFREAAQSFGLAPMAALVGLPMWAVELFQRDKAAFLDRWRRYCWQAADIMDGHVPIVQVWNEPNNRLQEMLDPRYVDLRQIPGGFPAFCQITARALSDVRPLEMAVNVTVDHPLWQRFVTALLAEAHEAVDIIGVDYYPRTWSVNGTDNWDPVNSVLERVHDPQDAWYGKRVAVIETGYSSFVPHVKTEVDQEGWINAAYPALRELNTAWVKRGGAGLRMIGWYKLFNDHDEQPLNTLAHFGILRQRPLGAPLVRKLGYEALRCQLHALRFQNL